MQRFLSVDPLAADYASWSPYNYVLGNPIIYTDPDGRSVDSPIFGKDGALLGTDDEGWTGEAIVMDEADFEQGMSHGDALESGTELGSYTEGIRISEGDWNAVGENGGSIMTPFVTNNSDFTISYKPETTQNGQENGGAYDLGAQSDYYPAVDGIAAPHIKGGEVFKAVTGLRITVSNTGATTSGGGTKQTIGQFIKGGWKNEAWNHRLNSSTTARENNRGELISSPKYSDRSWNNLFNKSTN